MKFAEIKLAGKQFHYKTALNVWGQHVCKLVREPDNVHDRNAVAVQLFGKTIGYIPREHNSLLAQWLDDPEASKKLAAKIETPRQLNYNGDVVRSVEFNPVISLYFGEQFEFEEAPPVLAKFSRIFRVPYCDGSLSTNRGTLVYYDLFDEFGVWDGTMTSDPKKRPTNDYVEVLELYIKPGCVYPIIKEAIIHGNPITNTKFNEMLKNHSRSSNGEL